MKSKKQKTKSEKGNIILFVVIDIVLVLVGVYGIFVSSTGGMEYINSPDKRIVNAKVVSVKHTYDKDDDGDITGEKWIATLRYTVDDKEYKTKVQYSTETYRGETVRIEVYKTSKGEFKVSGTSTIGFIISASVLLFGTVGLITENKERKNKAVNAKQNKSKT